eukprot:scaffold68297_cov17-Tisochrysis_lutea.AAC.1
MRLTGSFSRVNPMEILCRHWWNGAGGPSHPASAGSRGEVWVRRGDGGASQENSNPGQTWGAVSLPLPKAPACRPPSQPWRSLPAPQWNYPGATA